MSMWTICYISQCFLSCCCLWNSKCTPIKALILRPAPLWSPAVKQTSSFCDTTCKDFTLTWNMNVLCISHSVGGLHTGNDATMTYPSLYFHQTHQSIPLLFPTKTCPSVIVSDISEKKRQKNPSSLLCLSFSIHN